MQITNNAKAFFGALALVTAFSVALALSGVIGGDPNRGPVVAGDTFTPVATHAGDGSASPEVLTLPPPGVANVSLVAPNFLPPPGPTIAAPVEIPVLMYHRVLPDLPTDEFGAELTVTTEALDEQVSYLVCAGFTPITLARLFAGFDGSAALPTHPVVLTFDDGWAEHYTDVFPVLQSHGAVASFGIATGFIEAGGPYMTWAQIERMSDAGMEITSHTVSHLDLGTSDDETVRHQLEASKAELEERTGKRVDFLVYPGGEPFRSGTEERIARVVAMVADAGYRGALLASNRITQDPGAPFALNRLRVSGGIGLSTFAGSIYGPSPGDAGCR